jgi:hypothetical protein
MCLAENTKSRMFDVCYDNRTDTANNLRGYSAELLFSAIAGGVWSAHCV